MHVSPVVHGSPSSHVVFVSGAKTQAPVVALQESAVQTWRSSHSIAWLTHAPVAGSHVSLVHGLLSLQTTAVPQMPPWQVLPTVQALVSVHATPLGRSAWVHCPVLVLPSAV